VHYTYDVYDRLIGKQLDPTGGGTYTSAQRFVYDSAASPPSQGGVGGVTSNGNIALVFNSSGTLTDRFLNGPNENQTLADEKSGTINWYFTDNQGTVRDVAQYNSGTNTTSVVDHLKLDSFGNITAQSNSANQPLFAFTGQLFDAATGLYYDHARWYDPRTGRFVSQDPMGFAAGDANLYRYVGNSPANFTDPTGMEESGPNSVGAQAAQQAAEKEKEAAAEEGTEAAEAAKTATESYIEATDRMIERVNKMMLDFQNDRLKNIAERAKDLKAEKEKAESQHKLSAKEIAYFNEKVAALNRSRALAMGDANAAQAAVGHLAQGGNGALLGVLSPETGSSPVGWLGLSPGGMFGPKGDPESAKIVVGFTKVFDLGNGFILNVNTSLNISIFGGKTDETNTVNLGFSY
jgi:RHS repeat-associated protein